MDSEPYLRSNHGGRRKLSAAILYDGNDDVRPEPMPLQAGPLLMIFEPERACLRYVRLGDHEIIRGVYAAVRDRDWNTVMPEVSDLVALVKPDRFELAFRVMCQQREVDFRWNGTIRGTADGTVSFVMDGTAYSTFLRSRIGLCVLHPIRPCSGRPCEVGKTDGTIEHGVFPRYISPTQPFTDIRSIRHEVAPGLSAEVQFTGDTFEMEDQRNWTDASYKTYSTPLHFPFPVEVLRNATIRQSVTIRMVDYISSTVPAMPFKPVNIVLSWEDEPVHEMPRIGLSVAGHQHPLSPLEQQRLRGLNLSHLRVDLTPSAPNWRSTLTRAAEQAGALDCRLEVALFLSDAAKELRLVAGATENLSVAVARWMVFAHGHKFVCDECIRLARRCLSSRAGIDGIGSGTNIHFAEFNRGWPPQERLDFACWPITPQVHSSDNLSLVETLEVQADTIRTARELTGELPLVISPVTLKPRFNPHATEPESEIASNEPPPSVDTRQMSLFGAGWTLGSFKYLAEAGCHSVTYYETIGGRGVMETEKCPPLPERFSSLAGSVFPLYHVLADIGEFAGGEVLPLTSSVPLHAEGLALHKGDRTRILLANLTAHDQELTVRSPIRYARLKRLDPVNAEAAMLSPETFRRDQGRIVSVSENSLPLSLRPYSVARLDVLKESEP